MDQKKRQIESGNENCDFGRYLAGCRKAKKISLEVVSQKTKITTSCLRHIENEDMRHLPPGVLVKGFLKAYAAIVDGDELEVVRRYEAKCAAQARERRDLAQIGGKPKLWSRLLMVIVLFSVLVYGTLYIDKYFDGPKPRVHVQRDVPVESEPLGPIENGAEKSVEKPSEAEEAVSEPFVSESRPSDLDHSPAPKPPASDPSAPVSEPTAPEPALRLNIRAVEATWLKIIADGQKPKEFTMQPNDELNLEAKSQFNLLIGNAGGVRLMLNNKPMDVPGKSGQVVTLQMP